MSDFVSFGDWVSRRRQSLRMTQSDLAQRINSSLSMLRKIERDERRPSDELAALLAKHLALDADQRPLFLRIARGYAVLDMPEPVDAVAGLGEALAAEVAHQDKTPVFVGREEELRRLHGHLVQAVSGAGQLVFVAGEAGSGNTSLLSEFARQALDAWPDLLISGGASTYAMLGDPLLPFRDVFRLLACDVENAGMAAFVTPELVRRLARAFPATAQAIVEQGPHLLDTLVPSRRLQARLMQLDARGQHYAGLLIRLERVMHFGT